MSITSSAELTSPFASRSSMEFSADLSSCIDHTRAVTDRRAWRASLVTNAVNTSETSCVTLAAGKTASKSTTQTCLVVASKSTTQTVTLAAGKTASKSTTQTFDVGGWEDRLEVDHPDVSGRSEAWIRRELVNAHRASAERIQTTHLDKILTMCRPNAT